MPLITVVREYVTARPLNELMMYCKFSNNANPNPTEKPIWKPLLGESIILYKLKTKIALHISSPTGALIVKIRNSPNVPESIDVIPIEIKISGNSKELITIAGNVESIPAISIFSPSILVVIIWKCLVENAHQACTGNENPKSQAGTPINMAKTNQMGSLLSIAGNKPMNAVITVNENTIHRVEVGGISRGGESFTK